MYSIASEFSPRFATRFPRASPTVGDGPERGTRRNLAATLGVPNDIEFLGKQDHVERLIRLAHVVLMPSEMESFGLAALEAWHVEFPRSPPGSAASRKLGSPHGYDGFLARPGDIAALASYATDLIADGDLSHDVRVPRARYRPDAVFHRKNYSALRGVLRGGSGTADRQLPNRDCKERQTAAFCGRTLLRCFGYNLF